MAKEIQSYLRTYGLEQLTATYAIKASRHKHYPNLVCLKYNQINSPMHEKIVQQARGIILDEANNWAVVSYSYDKFFNYGEPLATLIDWDKARIFDKLDGSLMVLYPYQGKWEVQSSGMADASGNVIPNLSFRELFWKIWDELGYSLPPVQPYCFSFEMLSLVNRIIVSHSKANLILHGVRNLETLQEEAPHMWATKYNWEAVQTYTFHTWEALLDASEKLKPDLGEGYVVCDDQFRRVKVKSPQYVALHQLKDSLSPKRLLEVIMQNESDEVLAYFPELKKPHDDIFGRISLLAKTIEKTYVEHKDAADQKSFALRIKHLPYSGILFSLRANHVTSALEGLKQLHIDKLANLIQLEDFGDDIFA
jgi:hypothetical protein